MKRQRRRRSQEVKLFTYKQGSYNLRGEYIRLLSKPCQFFSVTPLRWRFSELYCEQKNATLLGQQKFLKQRRQNRGNVILICFLNFEKKFWKMESHFFINGQVQTKGSLRRTKQDGTPIGSENTIQSKNNERMWPAVENSNTQQDKLILDYQQELSVGPEIKTRKLPTLPMDKKYFSQEKQRAVRTL